MIIQGRDFPVATSDPLNKNHFKIIKVMKNRLKGKVLDFPAGTGRLSWLLYNEGFDLTAADIYIDRFRNPELPIFKADMDNRFPFDDGSFDYAFCIDGPGHAENIYHCFREFSRVLKKGSLFILSCKNYSNIESRLRNILYGVLEPVEPYIEKVEKINGHLSRPSYVLLKMALQHAGLEIESIHSDKIPYKQFPLIPIALIISIFTIIRGKKGKEKYWLNESNSLKILMGGNSLIISAKKIR
jgi:SAM-dependent methyltransferase